VGFSDINLLHIVRCFIVFFLFLVLDVIPAILVVPGNGNVWFIVRRWNASWSDRIFFVRCSFRVLATSGFGGIYYFILIIVFLLWRCRGFMLLFLGVFQPTVMRGLLSRLSFVVGGCRAMMFSMVMVVTMTMIIMSTLHCFLHEQQIHNVTMMALAASCGAYITAAATGPARMAAALTTGSSPCITKAKCQNNEGDYETRHKTTGSTIIVIVVLTSAITVVDGSTTRSIGSVVALFQIPALDKLQGCREKKRENGDHHVVRQQQRVF